MRLDQTSTICGYRLEAAKARGVVLGGDRGNIDTKSFHLEVTEMLVAMAQGRMLTTTEGAAKNKWELTRLEAIVSSR